VVRLLICDDQVFVCGGLRAILSTDPDIEVIGMAYNGEEALRLIAQRLFLSEGTVKNYVSAIFAKLEVSDRTQATIFALRNGLVKL
jgi:DNA-binding NarL/FixJ family response regulator